VEILKLASNPRYLAFFILLKQKRS